jgi:hypothetical protein
MKPESLRRRCAAALLLTLGACGGPPTTVDSGDALGQAFDRARAGAADDEILVVTWPTSTRKLLESELTHAPLAARLTPEGGLILMTDCALEGGYGYRGVTAAESAIRIAGTQGAGAGLPLVAGVHVGASTSAGGEGQLHRIQVGRYVLTNAAGLSLPETAGCAGVTHVVASADVGAFTLARLDESSTSGGMSLGVGQAQAGAGQSGTAQELMRDGDPERCAPASTADTAPPAGCGAILSIRLRPFGEATSPAPAGGEGTADPVPELLVGRWHSVVETTETIEGAPTTTRTEGDTVFLPDGSMNFEGTLDVHRAGKPDLRVRHTYMSAGQWTWNGRLTEKLLDLKTRRTEVWLDGDPVDPAQFEAMGVRGLEGLIPIGLANLAAVRFVDADHLEIKREEGVEQYERR